MLPPNLQLDVAGLVHKLFNQHTVVVEWCHCFLLGETEAFYSLHQRKPQFIFASYALVEHTDLLIVEGHAHALSSSTGGCFNHDWITNLIRNFQHLFIRVNLVTVQQSVWELTMLKYRFYHTSPTKPGMTFTFAWLAIFLLSILSPIASIADEGGPMNVTPSSSNRCTNFEFSWTCDSKKHNDSTQEGIR